MTLRCALLDDFQHVATTAADWTPVAGEVDVVSFPEHFATEDGLAAAVAGFDIIVTLRERVSSSSATAPAGCSARTNSP